MTALLFFFSFLHSFFSPCPSYHHTRAAEARRRGARKAERLASASDVAGLLQAIQAMSPGPEDARQVIIRTLTRLSELLASPAEVSDSAESVQELRLLNELTTAALILLKVSAIFETLRRADVSQAGAVGPRVRPGRGEEEDALARVIEVMFSAKSEDCKYIAGDDAIHDALRTCIFASIAGDTSLIPFPPDRHGARLLNKVASEECW